MNVQTLFTFVVLGVLISNRVDADPPAGYYAAANGKTGDELKTSTVAAVGMAGADYGEGTAIVFERAASGEWEAVAKVFNELPGYDPVLGGQVA